MRLFFTSNMDPGFDFVSPERSLDLPAAKTGAQNPRVRSGRSQNSVAGGQPQIWAGEIASPASTSPIARRRFPDQIPAEVSADFSRNFSRLRGPKQIFAAPSSPAYKKNRVISKKSSY